MKNFIFISWISLAFIALISCFINLAFSQGKDNSDLNILLENKLLLWEKVLKPSLSSTIPPDSTIFNNNQFEDIVNIGPVIIPVLIEYIQNDAKNPYENFACRHALLRITKWNYQYSDPSYKSQKYFALDDFPNIDIKERDRHSTKLWLLWWNEFHPNAQQIFERRYDEWKALLDENKKEETNMKYLKIIDIGIDALPFLVDKISKGDNELDTAVSILTNGQIKKNASTAEIVDFWRNNSEKWIIPINKK